jgi:DNA polymerase-3 subunit gamma/tau
MAYKALYRTYRPKDFEEIAGQEHITRTFKNALKNNKIAHAYLFSGPRGTGKTSIAKIIAKAVNCKQAPVSNPCNECDICKGIDNNTISDVIEIDAASNNGVDEIREIRDKVKYLPGVSTYKVYIIDEVHMLSQGAFNALLKTLEEPPKHVIFILATTEPHKIPATIHSRCQRFDFRGVSVPEMIIRMNTIIDNEAIAISQEAVKVIAESAEGGMRDAISLLDQVVSYTDKKVNINDVHAIRGTVSNERLLEIAQAIYENDSVKAIKLLDELVDLGKESQRLVENLIKFYRDLLIYKNTNTNESDQLLYQDDDFKVLANNLSNNLVFYYIGVLNKTQNDMKFTNNAKLYMELALIKMVDYIEKQEIIVADQFEDLKAEIRQLKIDLENIESQSQIRIEEKYTPEPVVESVQEVKLETLNEEEETPVFEADEEESDQENTLDDPILDIEEDEEFDSEDIEMTPSTVSVFDDSEEEDEEPEEIDEQEEPETTDLFSIADTEQEENNSFFEEVVEEEPYSTYDIRIIENVLNNGNREVKIKINKKWYDIERVASPLDMQYAKLITSGRLVATDGSTLIISYPSPSTCNRMMEPEIKETIKGMLSSFHELDLDYMAVPVVVWESVSAEFLQEWRKDRNKKIKLTPISHPGLKEIKLQTKKTDTFTPDSVKEAVQLFGRENVKVRRGDKK